MKKRRIALIALLVIMIVGCASIFAGCKKIVASQETIDYISSSIANSRKATTYTYTSKEVVSRLQLNVRSLMVQGNADPTLSRAKFEDTVNQVVSSTTVPQYFGPSLISTFEKPKKALPSDYKVYHFFDEKNFPVEGGKKGATENRYHISAITLEEFLNVESIRLYNVNHFLDRLQKLADKTWDFSTISINKQGWVTTYRFANIGKELASEFGIKLVTNKGVEKTAFPLVLEITNGRISILTDSKEDPSMTYSIAYGAANFGMPNYDKTY